MGIKISKISSGSIPITDWDFPIQLVTLKHPKGTLLKAHLHKRRLRKTYISETCFVIRKGKIILNLYTLKKIFFKKIILKEGQIFITTNGSGHSIKMLEDSEVLEIKNGPFMEDKILI